MLSLTKYSMFCLAFLLVLFHVSFAQDAATTSYPSCSMECLGKADPGSCSMEDNACLCANKPFVQATYNCFQSTCTDAAELKQAYVFAASLCKDAGVSSTIVAPPKRTTIPGEILRRGYPVAIKGNAASISVSASKIAWIFSGGIGVTMIFAEYF